MTDERFNERLGAFLRWQSGQTSGAPSAIDMADLVAGQVTVRRRARRPLAIVGLVALLTALLVATAVYMIGASRIPTLSMTDGPIVVMGRGCSLLARSTTGTPDVVLVPKVDGCLDGPGDIYMQAGFAYSSVSASADGRVIAVAREDFCGGCPNEMTPDELAGQGVLVGGPGIPFRRLPTADCDVVRCGYLVAVSPDGRRIASVEMSYKRNDPKVWATRIRLADLATDAEATIVEIVDRRLFSIDWSPDGRSVAITSVSSEQARDPAASGFRIDLIDGSSGAIRELVDVLGPGTFRWRPDSSGIVVMSDEAPASTSPSHVMDLRIVRVTDGATLANWSFVADGGLMIVTQDGAGAMYMRSSSDGSSETLYVRDFDGGERAVYTFPTGITPVNAAPFSPTGHSIALNLPTSADTYAMRVLVIPLDGGAPLDLGAGEVIGWLPGAH
jgi:hypothetical protein